MSNGSIVVKVNFIANDKIEKNPYAVLLKHSGN